MHYWIDGYNLLFYLPQLGLSKVSFEEKRRALILEIHQQAKDLSIQMTLVFDASDEGEQYDSRSHLGSLEIIYTHPGKSADEAILEAVGLSKTPSNLSVITSDKELASKASYLGANVLSLPRFLEFLFKKRRQKNRLERDSSKDFQDSPQEIQRLLQLFSKKINREDC
jgi:predicted RNA-binding protein with PIN domain